jgi:hypothetical protein
MRAQASLYGDAFGHLGPDARHLVRDDALQVPHAGRRGRVAAHVLHADTAAPRCRASVEHAEGAYWETMRKMTPTKAKEES